MFLKKYGDLTVGVAFLALAVVVYTASNAIPPNLLGSLGSDFLPKIVAIFCGVLSVIQIISGVRSLRIAKTGAAGEAEEAEAEDKPEYLRVLATVAVFAAYVFTMKIVGFPIGSAVYLFLQMCILAPKEKRNLLLFGVIAVVCSAAVYFIFRSGLNVMLPAGILG